MYKTSILRRTVLTTSLLLSCRTCAAFTVRPSLLSSPPFRATFPSYPLPKMELSTTTASDAQQTTPFAIIVQAEIQSDRLDEFLTLIETNAVESRKEPGCLRFDVVQSQTAPNQFFFYEVYQNPAAVDFHKAQPHYNLWANFKESGGVIASTSYKTNALFLT